MDAGAIGCSVGRNIFMHTSPEAITRALVAGDPRAMDRGRRRLRGHCSDELSGVMRAAFMTAVERRRGPRG